MNINIGKIGLGAGGPYSMTLNVQQGDPFFTDITTDNPGSAQIKDFCSFFGSYNEATGGFTAVYGFVTENVNITTGTKITTVSCQADGSGPYDCLGGFGSYDATAHTFTLEVGAVLKDAINVGAGGEIAITDIIVRL
jgi:hypothetical protein